MNDPMEWFVRAFLRAALAWLALGVTLGLALAVHPVWLVYRPAHLHMNLLGFVAMMIFGVAYHVIPRFVGRPLHSNRLAGAQWWVSNAGLALLVLGFACRPHTARAIHLLLAGGLLSAAGAYGFAYNIWRTLGPVVAPAPARPPVRRRALPLAS